MSALRPVAVAVETGATALWVGASAGFAFVFAPIAFRLITDRDTFAALTEQSLAKLALLSNVCGGLAGTVALLRAGFERDGRGNDVARACAAGAALAAIAYHQRAIVPAMTRAQAAMGGLHARADDDPARIAYRAMHQQSTRVFGTALVLGIAQLVMTVTRPAPQHSDI